MKNHKKQPKYIPQPDPRVAQIPRRTRHLDPRGGTPIHPICFKYTFNEDCKGIIRVNRILINTTVSAIFNHDFTT